MRPTLRPISQGYGGFDSVQATDILLLVSKIQEQLKDIDATIKSSDYTIRKAEKEVESLLRRSKDNAGDLVSLREKVLNTEHILNNQLSGIVDAVSVSPKSVAQDIKKYLRDDLKGGDWARYNQQVKSLEDTVDNLFNSIGKLSVNLENQNQAIKGIKTDGSDNQSLSLVQSHIGEMQRLMGGQSESLNKILLACSAASETTSENLKQDELSDLLPALKSVEASNSRNFQEMKDRDKRLWDISCQLRDLMTKNLPDQMQKLAGDKEEVFEMLKNISGTQTAVAESLTKIDVSENSPLFESVNSRLNHIDERMTDTGNAILSSVQSLLQDHVSLVESKVQSVDLFQTESTQKLSALTATLEDIKTTTISSSESITQNSPQLYSKLDSVADDIKTLSANLQPLSLLPDIYSNFMETAARSTTYLPDEQARLTGEIEDLRQEKARMAQELALLEATVTSRTKELDLLEKRAHNFQQKLNENLLSQLKFRDSSGINVSALQKV